MLTLHHLENSRSFRILWLLEELQLDYELVNYRRDKKTGMAESTLKSRHALGKAPLLTDGDLDIMESGAIIEYLLDNYDDGSLRPAPKTPERVHYNVWLHAAEGNYMSLLVLMLFLNRMDSRSPFFIRPVIKLVTSKVRESYVNPNMEKSMSLLEDHLAGHEWFAGKEFSGADIQMGFVMTALSARGGLNDNYPNCQRWLKQAEARPGYQRAMEKNGPMQLLGS